MLPILDPLVRKLVLALAAIAVAGAALGGLLLKARGDGAAAERPKVEAALDVAETAGLEAQGAREAADWQADADRQRAQAATAVSAATVKARSAGDANEPLSPDRAARLRDLDRQLCDARPTLAGCAAEDRDAGGGAPAVRPVRPAARADADDRRP